MQFYRSRFSIFGSIPLLFCLYIGASYAESVEEKGLAIAKERIARDTGWGDSYAEMSMILRNSSGQESERKIRVSTLEMQEDGDKGLTVFDEPRDVKGSAFLSFSHSLEPDDQWMYLPALKRVKRIATQNKSGPFMGSEFSYEDMASFELEKFRFTYLRDENYQGESVYVLQQVPLDEYSGYSKQIVWVDKTYYRAVKVEFYDRKNALLKVLELDNYKQFKDKFWRPMRSTMRNVQNGKSTVMLTHKIEFGTGLDESDFNKNSLQRAR